LYPVNQNINVELPNDDPIINYDSQNQELQLNHPSQQQLEKQTFSHLPFTRFTANDSEIDEETHHIQQSNHRKPDPVFKLKLKANVLLTNEAFDENQED